MSQDLSDESRPQGQPCKGELTAAEIEILRMILTPVFQRIVDSAFGEGPEQLALKNGANAKKMVGRTQVEHARLAHQPELKSSRPVPGSSVPVKRDSREP